MGEREKLRQRFNDVFAQWDIELPMRALSPGKIWFIVQRGWTIWTRFDIDPGDGRQRLDYYAMHRMTNDQHVRFYADGEVEVLQAIRSEYVYSENATAEERKTVKKKFYAYNQAVARQLDEKGFAMTSHAHGSARINRFCLTNPDASG